MIERKMWFSTRNLYEDNTGRAYLWVRNPKPAINEYKYYFIFDCKIDKTCIMLLVNGSKIKENIKLNYNILDKYKSNMKEEMKKFCQTLIDDYVEKNGEPVDKEQSWEEVKALMEKALSYGKVS